MNYTVLPENYAEIGKINFKKNKRLALTTNIITAAVAIAMFVIAYFITGVSQLLATFIGSVVRAVVLLCTVFLQPLAEELIRGLTLAVLTKHKVSYTFKSLGLVAVSKTYLDKKSYIVSALLPNTVLFVILLIVNILVPSEWFWVVYLIQILNVAGLAANLCKVYAVGKMTRKMLVRQSGSTVFFYKKVNPQTSKEQ